MGSFPPWGAVAGIGADWARERAIQQEEERLGTNPTGFWPNFGREAFMRSGMVPGQIAGMVGSVPRALSDPFGDVRLGEQAFNRQQQREAGTVLPKPVPTQISEDGTPRPGVGGHNAPGTQKASDIPSPTFFERPGDIPVVPVKPSPGIIAEFRDGNSGPITYTTAATDPSARVAIEGKVNPEQERIRDLLLSMDAGMRDTSGDAFAAMNAKLSEMNPFEVEEAMRRAQGPLAPLFMQRQRQQADYEKEQAQIAGEQRQESIARRRVLGNEPEQAWLEKRATLIAEDLKQQLLSDPARQGRPLTKPEALQIEQEAKVRAEVMLSDLMMRSFFSQINRYPGSPTGGLDPFGG